MSELDDKGLPPQAEVERQLLIFLGQRPAGVKTAVVYKELAVIMQIDRIALAAKRDSDGRNLWQNLVRFAYRRLKDNGQVNDGPRGLWSVGKR